MRNSNALVRFVKDDEGTTSVEYAGMLALIVLALQMAVAAMGSATNDGFNQANQALAAANSVQGP
jgi:Flp pilus assembly pilin Flp